MTIRFDNRVAIVTGAGNGLGRSHALELAARGAKVVVNDLGGARDGVGESSTAAESVVEEIVSAGGEAIASGANVADFTAVEKMVEEVLERWGRVDILINNAGILRDKSFSKMPVDDFRLVMEVHLMGSVNCTKAVWDIMKSQNYGRIVMTTSSSGLYGNFGQANYGAAKMALIGLMNTLGIEGDKYNVKVNCLAPTAATRMTEDLMPKEILEMLVPEAVTAGALMLCESEAPNREIICAGAGGYASAKIFESDGIYLPPDKQTLENVVAAKKDIFNTSNHACLENGSKQSEKFLMKAYSHLQKS